MATPIAKCSRCGAETQLYRADIPYCVNCVDKIEKEQKSNKGRTIVVPEDLKRSG